MKIKYHIDVRDSKVYALQMDGILPLRVLGPIEPDDLTKDPSTLQFGGDVDKTIDSRNYVRLCDNERRRLIEGKIRKPRVVTSPSPSLANRFSIRAPHRQ